MNIKKIGLTALAGSLVATSAFAGEMSVTGGAEYCLKQSIKPHDGHNSFSMGDSLNFSGTGELDNGLTVTTKVEIDGDAEDNADGTVISGDGLGTLTFVTKWSDTAMVSKLLMM